MKQIFIIKINYNMPNDNVYKTCHIFWIRLCWDALVNLSYKMQVKKLTIVLNCSYVRIYQTVCVCVCVRALLEVGHFIEIMIPGVIPALIKKEAMRDSIIISCCSICGKSLRLEQETLLIQKRI